MSATTGPGCRQWGGAAQFYRLKNKTDWNKNV